MPVDWNMLTPVQQTPFDVGDIMKDVRLAQEGNRKTQQYNALLTAGKRMQAGDVSGARGELYASGNFDQAMQTDKFQMDKDNQARERNARIAFSIKSPDDLKRVQETFTRLGQPIPLELSSLDNAAAHARSFAMTPHETVSTDIARTSADRAARDADRRFGLDVKKFDMTTPEYRERMGTTYGGADWATDPRRPGFVGGIPDKPPSTITLPKDARIIGLPTPGRPGSTYTDVTPDPAGGPTVSHETRNDEHKLRSQFLAQADEFIKVRDAFNRIKTSATDSSAASDMSMIFNYMKMLDPGSVVREGEYATAQNAAGVPDRLRALYGRVISGERLAPAQRADFLQQGEKLYAAQNVSHQQLRSEVARIATASGLDPRRVLLDVERTTRDAGNGMVDPASAGRVGPAVAGRFPGGLAPVSPRAGGPGPAAPPGAGPAAPPDAGAALFMRAPVGHSMPAPVDLKLDDGTVVPKGTRMEKGSDGKYRPAPVPATPFDRLRGMRE